MKNIQQNEKKRNYNGYFSFAEREIIEKMKKQHVSNRKIGKILGRGKSSISDEINRYKTRASGYEACLAQKQFERNQKNKGNKKKIDNNEKTKKYILEKLDEDRSPEEISGRIKLFHNDPYMDDYIPYVCHETIYSYLYAEENKKLKLYSKLRRHRPKRVKHGTRKKNTVDVIIKDRVSINERENIIEKKERVGDFESDSVVFPGQKPVLNTNICRVSRLARIELVKDKSLEDILKKNIGIEKYNLNGVTISKIRGFYKRNNLKCKKIKTTNREYRSPFDFQNTMAFSRLYTDIKHIPDQHALPLEIYNKFKYSCDNDGVIIKGFPKYELNVMEQNTRVRFIAYLTEIDSHLIMNFVEYVIQFIRGNNFLPSNEKITIGMDGGTDFLSGSEKKIKKYNKQIKYLNAEYYCYDGPKDTRKNLIERSHLSDDLEFFIPRGYSINTKRSFLTEATKYQKYRNFHRTHTGRFMNNLTHIEKAKKLGVYNINVMSIFPTLILQDFYREVSAIHHSGMSQYVLTQDLIKNISICNTISRS